MLGLRNWTQLLPYACILLAFLALWNQTYPEVYRHPGESLFSNAGDGWKNYYTFLYHARHDTTAHSFSGMHYPFGEHVVYADAQPALSGTLSVVDQVWPGGIKQPVFWLNWLLMLAFPLGAFFLYSLLRRFDVPISLAMLGAVVLIWMCPQTTRLPFYLGLSYPFVLPVGLWLYLRYRDYKRPWRWTLAIVAYVLCMGWVHPYWILQLAAMYGALGLVLAWQKKEQGLSIAAQVLMQTILPLLIFSLHMQLTDTHTGRNPDPGGFYEFTSIPANVFLPPELDGTWYSKFFSRTEADFYQHWEGRAYIGWLGNLAWIVLLGLLVLRRFCGKAWRLPTGLPDLLVGSVLVLLLSMGIPFQLKSLAFLVEAVPAIKQFRAIGRLALLFYFGSGILGLALLGALIRRQRYLLGQVLAWGLALGACYITYGEAETLHAENRRMSPPHANLFDRAVLSQSAEAQDLAAALEAIEVRRFQAIVPLPFYHIGTEALSPETAHQRNSIRESMVLSYHTGLPLTGAYLARTSLPETRAAFSFFTPKYWKKPLQSAFRSSLDLLVYYDKRVRLDVHQERIRQQGKIIFENASIELRSLSLNGLWSKQVEPIFQAYESGAMGPLQEVRGLQALGHRGPLVYNEFEGQPSRMAFRGGGAWEAPMEGTHVLFDFSPDGAGWEVNHWYRISFWFNHAEDRTQVKFFIGKKDASGEYVPQIQRPDALGGFVTEGDWTLVNWVFKAPENIRELALVFQGKYGVHNLMVDNLLIHEDRTHLYKPLEYTGGKLTRLWMDNLEIERD